MTDKDKVLLLTAVLHADPEEMRKAGVTEYTAVPLLQSARSDLEKLLQEDPDSKLAYKLRDLLKEKTLFHVMGPWPPTQSGQPVGGAPSQKVCGACGRVLP